MRTSAARPQRTAPRESIRSARDTSSLARGRAFVRAVPTASREVEYVGADRSEREPGIAAVEAILHEQERPHDEHKREGEGESRRHEVLEADARPLSRRRGADPNVGAWAGIEARDERVADQGLYGDGGLQEAAGDQIRASVSGVIRGIG